MVEKGMVGRLVRSCPPVARVGHGNDIVVEFKILFPVDLLLASLLVASSRARS